MEQEELRISLADIDKLTRTYRLDKDQFLQMLNEMKLSPEEAVAVIRQTQINLKIDLSEILEEELPKSPAAAVEQPVKNSDFEESKPSTSHLKILIFIGVLVFLLIILILELLFLF